MSWLRTIHFLGLTNLSDEDLRNHEADIAARFDKRLILIWGSYFLALAFLNFAALAFLKRAVSQPLFPFPAHLSDLEWLSAMLFILLASLAWEIAEYTTALLRAEDIRAYLESLLDSRTMSGGEVPS